MKAYWGSGDKGPCILGLDTTWRWVVSFTLRSLYPQRKSPSYLLDRKLAGPQNRSGSGGRGKFPAPTGTGTPDHSAHCPALHHWASPSFCNILQSPVISSLLVPNILLSTLFSDTFSLCYSLNVRDQVWNPYKQQVKLWYYMFLAFKFLEKRKEDKRFWTEW
jgi:hypothetical protein